MYAYLLILEGMFSDDMITTGISLREDDSWLHNNWQQLGVFQ
jgi:hypothetical protein